jgi:stress response protein YsnF
MTPGVRPTDPKRRVIPLAAEEAAVTTRRRITGKVRVTKVIRRDQRTIAQAITKDEVRIERVPIKRFVDGPVPIRHEGETIVAVTLRREEAHITRNGARRSARS